MEPATSSRPGGQTPCPDTAGVDGAVPGRPATFAGQRGDYAHLSRQVRAVGLLARRTGYYRVRIGLTLGSFAAAWVGLGLLGPSWWQPAIAAALAVVSAQIGFLGHDAGHRQVFASRRANDLLGVLCANLLIGLSYGWWIDKHNRHHARPNQVGSDPDIAGAGIAFTPAQADARRTGPGRWIARHQDALFFPMLLLEGLSLHWSSIEALARRPDTPLATRGRLVESLLLATHIGGYLTAVLLVLPPVQAAAFIAVHQGLFGLYLGCSFAPSHKGMPLLTGEEGLDFLRRQVLTSRNTRGPRWLDTAMGGLNYQIEHHLFPSMPSPTLRRAQPLIRAFCARHDLPYQESTLLGSYTQVLRYLHIVGATAGRAA